jgi:hypothetical protein
MAAVATVAKAIKKLNARFARIRTSFLINLRSAAISEMSAIRARFSSSESLFSLLFASKSNDEEKGLPSSEASLDTESITPISIAFS